MAVVALVGAAVFWTARPLGEPQGEPAGGVAGVAAGYLAAHRADLGTPAFVDGLAGLLLVRAGRDTARAGAIARAVLAGAPAADEAVAAALRLAGFDPAVAALQGAASSTRAAVADDRPGTVVVDRAIAPPGRALVHAVPAASRGAAVAPFGTGDGGGPADGAPTLSAAQTARPGPADLATPQLR